MSDPSAAATNEHDQQSLPMYPLDEPSASKRAWLQRFDGVQSEVRISPADAPSGEPTAGWGWLRDATRDTRVVFLGEEHYHRATHELRDLLLWSLHEWHGFDLLLVEEPYSLTGPMDHYLSLGEDRAAAAYHRNTLSRLLPNGELLDLLARIRQHNGRAGTSIRVAAHDLEHRPRQVRRYVLEPFLRARGLSLPGLLQGDAVSLDDWHEALPSLRATVDALPDSGLGPFSAAFVRSVLRNLQDTIDSQLFEPGNGRHRRQRAIIRNLTDPAFVGERLARHRTLVHCGWYHALRRVPDGEDDLFLHEAAYLDRAFEATRGRVYSLRATSLGVRFEAEDLGDAEVSRVLDGTGFSRLLDAARQAHETTGLQWGREYRAYGQAPLLEHWLLRVAHAWSDDSPRWWRVEQIPWKALVQLARASDDPDMVADLKRWQWETRALDASLLVRSSRPIRALASD